MTAPNRALPPPETCAQCGAEIPPRAHACPECGADERTGWRETSVYDGLDLPEAADDRSDLTYPARRNQRGIPWYWWITALGLLILLGLGALALR